MSEPYQNVGWRRAAEFAYSYGSRTIAFREPEPSKISRRKAWFSMDAIRHPRGGRNIEKASDKVASLLLDAGSGSFARALLIDRIGCGHS